MFIYSPLDDADNLYRAGFRVGKGLPTAVALTRAESGYDPNAKNVAGNTPPSTDRGLRQINSYWHPEVTDDVAYDPARSAVEMFRISKQGSDFGAWSAFQNGAYKAHMDWAWVVVDGYARITQATNQLAQAQAQITELQRQAVVQSGINTSQAKTIADLQSQLSADVTGLQSQLDEMTKLKDDALGRATAAETLAGTVQAHVDDYIATLRKELLG